MKREIVVVTSAYGNDRVKALGGQRTLLPIIAAAGANGVEIRRELCSADELADLTILGNAIAACRLMACYSAPEALFNDDGQINPRLPALLEEARQLKACWLKLSLGAFPGGDVVLAQLQDYLSPSTIPLVVENDQTRYGRLAPMQRFQAACRVNALPVTLTFDMGNWLWVDDSPEQAARHLAPSVSYIHVKAARPDNGRFRAVPPDTHDSQRWSALLAQLPDNVPRGIEFPLEGEDLIAVTRRYVNALREE
ncbi:sugar phosphate isomerase/epimerase [Shimwellia pseudoproteus]|uniref:sugar phosphate isomerase/epimerase family protein n=1 Tax=Shimwellia pseudoproteus TaxID=570012 RepID=UPI0018EB23C8|nr:sugar phosphate isomerase/epimerase [Shimwellia pseudoproteus]MBJ3814293.1 sugar phosphate isomerase/epimerase [Shimwellia pseudoproteus]